jgi:hypothetical protein
MLLLDFYIIPVKIWNRTPIGAMVQTVTGNLVEVSSAVWIEIFNGVNYFVNRVL